MDFTGEAIQETKPVTEDETSEQRTRINYIHILQDCLCAYRDHLLLPIKF